MEIEAVWSGFRPTTDDDAPIIGETGIPGLLIATGHHRNGILLAPVTAAAIEQLVTTGSMCGAAQLFGLKYVVYDAKQFSRRDRLADHAGAAIGAR